MCLVSDTRSHIIGSLAGEESGWIGVGDSGRKSGNRAKEVRRMKPCKYMPLSIEYCNHAGTT